jgi:hypothetical protein
MAEDYVASVKKRLLAEGFTWGEATSPDGRQMWFAAAKTRRAWVPLPLRETIILAQFPSLDVPALRRFSAESLGYARDLSRNCPSLSFMPGCATCSYAVAIVRNVDPATVETVQNEPPRSHGNGQWEIPILYDQATGQIHYFLNVPLFGNALCADFQKAIRKRLALLPGQEPRGAILAQEVVTLDAALCRVFRERLQLRQHFGLAIVGGTVAAVFASWIWGALTALSGMQMEWLPLVGLGFLVGTAVRFCGQGVTRRFGIVGATFALVGCFLGYALSLAIAVAWQIPGLDNFYLFSHFQVETFVRLAWAKLHWSDLACLGFAGYEGYILAFRRISDQELRTLAYRGGKR